MALSQQYQWVAAYTAPRAEKMVTDRIANELQLQAYVPLHHVLRRWSDRTKSVQVPLIPSYTFVKMREADLWRVREIKGVCGFVSFPSTGIAVIPETDMQNLRRLAESMAEVHVHNLDQLTVGAHVNVLAGEFQGMSGVIVRDDHAGNFAVEISGLNLYLTVTIQQDLLQYTDPPKSQPVGLLYK
jgi:transcription antitermination factor NusG